jgi:hypothetical protein
MGIVCFEVAQAPLLVKRELVEEQAAVLDPLGEWPNRVH